MYIVYSIHIIVEFTIPAKY